MEIVKVEDNKNNVVVKHKDLVWEARYRLSELGIKVMAVLISMIRVNDDDFKKYKLKINNFKELIGTDSKNTYDYTHRLIKELLSKTLKIGDEQFAWISYGKYVEGSDVIEIEINRHLKPYLLFLQGSFLKYNIVNILPLKSSYVIRLYELFKSKFSEFKHYNKSAKSFTFELKIDWLREHFQLPASYQYSSGIKLRIIEKAQKQFKEKTDIQFDYEEQKIGRKVDRLIITVKENNKGSNDYLANRRAFIAYVRKHYQPDPTNNVFPTILDGDLGKIKVDLKGNIYLLKNDGNIEEYSKERADALWSWLYEMAQLGNLPGI